MELPPILFPDVKVFAELFDRVTPFRGKPGDSPRVPSYSLVEGADKPAKGAVKDGVPIGPYCYRHTTSGEYRSYDVYPNELLATALQRRMLWIQYDSIHFKIVDHNDGMSLVVASYNLIIGSHWLARVRSDSIPDFSIPRPEVLCPSTTT